MNPLMKIQADATRDAMQAKQEFEMESQVKKVEALAQQVRERADQLAERAKQVSYDALYADERPIYLGNGYFGKDTETLDALIASLSEECQTLDHMRTAFQKQGELHEKYEARIEAEMPGEAVVLSDGAPVPPGGAEVFEMPAASGGGYL